ncbi:relaxase/mobilization nuclease domain-containing protein [Flavobacterium sp. GT3P67]|uniref:relaxase/mobilization nuclease domain-containing protein n=1 Tax=Flavobacterium sp. GT3P67 TaxID=2541722 RepID=UPI0010501DF6|nr:relaxase/mobilization nuclease domain-containing protein [Flavobacterium sp. GT3P67]TDE55379.1 mobilization protein [Flavobacterium sp. GT3P67]
MIGKASACPGGTALFNYVISDKKGYELTRNGLSGTTPKELYDDMNIIQKQNSRCNNNTISIVISPTVDDGEKLSDTELKAITEAFLTELDLDPKKQQYLAFIHTEKDHKHIHVLLNRVQENGKLIQDNFIGKRAQHAAHRVAIKYGMTSARELKYENESKRAALNKDIKQHIKTAHLDVLKQNPRSLNAYKRLLLLKSIELIPTVNKQGQIQGYRFLDFGTGTNLKASEVDRNLKLNDLFLNKNEHKFNIDNTPAVSRNTENNSPLFNPSVSTIPVTNDQDENLKKRKKKKGFKR